MRMRSDDPPGEGAPASWGSPVEGYASFDAYGGRVSLHLRDVRAGRPGLARSVVHGELVYSEITEEEAGSSTEPVLSLTESEARAIYKALHREFGAPEVRYADAEFMRSVYDREATRLDRLLFGDD